MKFRSKRELIERVEREHDAFVGLANSIPARRWREAGVWGEDWTVADLYAHLAEWHRMLLRWVDDGRAGRTPQLPAPGFKWNQTPALNREIQRRFARRSTATLVAEFEATYLEVLALVEDLSEAELLESGRLAWTSKSPLASYVAPNTCSHYAAARKILGRWLRASPARPQRASKRPR